MITEDKNAVRTVNKEQVFQMGIHLDVLLLEIKISPFSTKTGY